MHASYHQLPPLCHHWQNIRANTQEESEIPRFSSVALFLTSKTYLKKLLIVGVHGSHIPQLPDPLHLQQFLQPHRYQEQTHHLLPLDDVTGGQCSAVSLNVASNSGSFIGTTLGYASPVFGGGSKPAATTLSLFEDGHSLLRHGHKHHLSLDDNLGIPHVHHKHSAGQELQHHLSVSDNMGIYHLRHKNGAGQELQHHLSVGDSMGIHRLRHKPSAWQELQHHLTLGDSLGIDHLRLEHRAEGWLPQVEEGTQVFLLQ